MSDDDLATIYAMQVYGGSFVKALAVAATCADPMNLAKLKVAFPEYWEEYRGMARHLPERR